MTNLKKNIILYPLMIILVLTGVFTLNMDYTYGAESFKVGKGTKWVSGQNIDSGMRITAANGKVAYCLNEGRALPSGSYNDKMNLSTKAKAVLYLGYPNNAKFGTISLTSDQARCATQLALWANDDSGKGNKINLSKLKGRNADGTKVLNAAKWIHTKAKAGYKAPAVPSFAAPKITKPADKTPKYFNSSYVRVGPYRYTTTSNSYTSNNKVSVSLSGAPTGSKIGDSAGNFISKPVSGKDFYVYLPSDKLTEKGSKTFSLSASYSYKYEKASTFTAYKKSSTQNIAVATSKSYATGSKSVNTSDRYSWTVGKLTKIDAKDKDKPIADTDFEVYYDPTPKNISNNDWKLMYTLTTDANGVIKIPGLGIGRYKLVEVKSNPDYAMNSEIGGSDEIIFDVNDVTKESVQIMSNKKIGVSCQIDKDTIKKTSAAYKSLPGQEGIDNTGMETYRYNLDYRSTSGIWADEFTVDDHLEGVANNQIRVTELWTPVAWGDYDSKMNVWYKTNKTDDSTIYSDVSALSSNPDNPNNPSNESVKKNTGYKLWAKDVSTLSRTNLKVSDLGLDEDEYITAVRFEHGRVEVGFTTKNYSSESMNDDGSVDWTPSESTQFYDEECAKADGLKPVTYLVMCPNPLTPPEVINNSADAFIARNLQLTDEDKDEVKTEVIDTFKENPIDELGPKTVKGEDSKPKSGKSQTTGDSMMTKVMLMLILLSTACIYGALVIRNKKKGVNGFGNNDSSNVGARLLPAVLIAVLLTGSLLGGVHVDNAYAASNIKLKSEVQYVKRQSQIDKTEVIKGLKTEDVTDLPTSKVYEVRSDKSPGATEMKTLKRAGVSYKISGYDSDGIPNKWDATIVYRGLEKYIESK